VGGREGKKGGENCSRLTERGGSAKGRASKRGDKMVKNIRRAEELMGREDNGKKNGGLE